MEQKNGLEIYQLILEGRYSFSGNKAMYEDINIFSDLELITPEYIAEQKSKMTINALDFLRWDTTDSVIIHYIRTYNFVCEKEDII